MLKDIQQANSETPNETWSTTKQCNPCTDCGVAGVSKQCTTTSDTVCKSVCKSGTYSATGFEPCQKYSTCEGGISVPGTYTEDVTCESVCPSGTYGAKSKYGPPCFSPCPEGTYTDTGYGANCFDCQECDAGVISKCTRRENTVCDSQPKPSTSPCPTGFYSPDTINCYKCQECDAGVASECTPHENTVCVTCDEDHFYGKALDFPTRNGIEAKHWWGDNSLDWVARMRKLNSQDVDNETTGCHRCQNCRRSGIKEACTKTSDTVCNPLCVPGKTYSSTGFEPCTQSTPCEYGIYESSYTSDNKCKSPSPSPSSHPQSPV